MNDQPSAETPVATRPICGKCGKPMSPEDSTIHPELFMHDACLPTELLLRDAQAGAPVAGVEQKRELELIPGQVQVAVPYFKTDEDYQEFRRWWQENVTTALLRRANEHVTLTSRVAELEKERDEAVRRGDHYLEKYRQACNRPDPDVIERAMQDAGFGQIAAERDRLRAELQSAKEALQQTMLRRDAERECAESAAVAANAELQMNPICPKCGSALRMHGHGDPDLCLKCGNHMQSCPKCGNSEWVVEAPITDGQWHCQKCLHWWGNATGGGLLTPTSPNEAEKDAFDWEQFNDSPECQKCYCAMSLSEGCEWPDDPRLLLCRECTYRAFEESLSENARLTSKLAEMEKEIAESRRLLAFARQFGVRSVSYDAMRSSSLADDIDAALSLRQELEKIRGEG